MKYSQTRPTTPVAEIVNLISGPAPSEADRWSLGFHQWENVQNSHQIALHTASYRSSDPPQKKGVGVIVYGGGRYLASAYVTIRAIRHVGYSGPVELFYRNATEIDSWHVSLFSGLGVKCVNAESFNDKRRIFEGWHLKPFALRRSSFRQVFAFDADCYPAARNVVSLLRKESVKYPTVFLRDPPQYNLSPATWEILGLGRQNIPGFESGFMAMDTVDCWRELELTQWINDHSDYYYQHFWGDKESFSLAWNYYSTPYFQPPRHYCKIQHSLLHYWTDNLPLVVHRTEDKFTVERKTKDTLFPNTHQASGRNVFVPELPLEFECWQWLKEYRDAIKQRECAVCS